MANFVSSLLAIKNADQQVFDEHFVNCYMHTYNWSKLQLIGFTVPGKKHRCKIVHINNHNINFPFDGNASAF